MIGLILNGSMLLCVISGAAAQQTAAPSLEEHCAELRGQLSTSERARNERLPVLEARIQQISAQLDQPEAPDQPAPATDVLRAERTQLQAEMNALETILTAHKSAVDACEATTRYRQELDRVLKNPAELKSMSAADLAAMNAQLAQVQAARDTLATTRLNNTERLETLATQIEGSERAQRDALLLEQRKLEAERAALHEQMESYDAQHALLAARIKAVGQAAPATQAPQAPAEPQKEETEALNKQRMAEQLDAQARDRLGQARATLTQLQAGLETMTADSPERKKAESDIEYWLRVEQFEQRRIKQAELVQRAAQEKKAIAQLKGRLDEVLKTQELLRQQRGDLDPAQRQDQAGHHLGQQEQALARAADLLSASEAKRAEAEPLSKILPSLNALQDALKERVLSAELPETRVTLENHYRRMVRQLDSERQQIDLMIMTTENIAFAIARQADLERQLADSHGACAEILVPAVPSFWERHRRILSSLRLLAMAFGVSYGLKLLIWLIGRGLLLAQRVFSSARVSLKRMGTMLAFFGSIVKLFVWVFAIIAILDEFGIDPKQSSGAIGLIGLILAGMFQQIVVDFVKGLDIVIGKHYYVGDFVEVDGKCGHVVDFDVKHTRIRTLSGQEYNLPNSRCVPSRRFPDGFVTNYVDFLFKNVDEADRARPTIEAVGRDLNQRIEAIRDEPVLDRFFHEVDGGIIGRYRVRVLPGCPWVINDYFVPEVRKALGAAGLELAAEPSHTFINRIDTFRKLFSRQMTEEEIIREVKDTAAPPLASGDPSTTEEGDAPPPTDPPEQGPGPA